ncbi:MAG: ubiquinol-cytochrome c reductase iron-sulfur subunit N-terminal domain-containing protein, partial [Nitratireductor sp.]
SDGEQDVQFKTDNWCPKRSRRRDFLYYAAAATGVVARAAAV